MADTPEFVTEEMGILCADSSDTALMLSISTCRKRGWTFHIDNKELETDEEIFAALRDGKTSVGVSYELAPPHPLTFVRHRLRRDHRGADGVTVTVETTADYEPLAVHAVGRRRTRREDMDDDDFADFCRNATNDQLESILLKEYRSSRLSDYRSACTVAASRGWTVRGGRRI